jgi:phosphatidylethanolamine-binding protein (PEBP) family uncharacterized protein
MRFTARIVLGFIALLAALVLVLSLRASGVRHADAAYHAVLSKSVAVTSQSFAENGAIAAELTCRGRGDAPQIGWDHVPTGTMSFVLAMVDWDVPTPKFPLNAFTHWILYNIPRERRQMQGHIIAYGETEGTAGK